MDCLLKIFKTKKVFTNFYFEQTTRCYEKIKMTAKKYVFLESFQENKQLFLKINAVTLFCKEAFYI
jgi:hypothetical protein